MEKENDAMLFGTYIIHDIYDAIIGESQWYLLVMTTNIEVDDAAGALLHVV